jgi:hypothetical protein
LAKLTDTQLIVLSAAAARADGIAVVTRKVMREVRSKPRMPVWRKGEDDRPISLTVTRAGRAAVGVEEDPCFPRRRAWKGYQNDWTCAANRAVVGVRACLEALLPRRPMAIAGSCW